MVTYIFLLLIINLVASIPFGNIKNSAPWVDKTPWKFWILETIFTLILYFFIFVCVFFLPYYLVIFDFFLIMQILSLISGALSDFVTGFLTFLSLSYFNIFIFFIQVLLMVPVIFFIIDWGFSKNYFIKTLQVIFTSLVLFFIIINALIIISDGIYKILNVDIIKYFNDFLSYWFNAWVYGLLSDNFGLAFLNSDEIIFNLSFYTISATEFLNTPVELELTSNYSVKINQAFTIFCPIENGDSSTAVSSASNHISSPTSKDILSVSETVDSYNFSINKETVKQLANATMDAVKSNLAPELGKNVSQAIGAAAGVKGGLELVKNSPMPLPAKVATVAFTAGLTTLTTTTAAAAAESLIDFAESAAESSVYSQSLPEGRAPSPTASNFDVHSPLESSWNFSFSLPKDRDPLGVLLTCVLVFQLINLFLSLYLSYLFVMNIFSKSYGDKILLFFANNFTFLPSWIKSFINNTLANIFNLHNTFYKFIGIFFWFLFFFNLLFSIVIIAVVLANIHQFVEISQQWYNNQKW